MDARYKGPSYGVYWVWHNGQCAGAIWQSMGFRCGGQNREAELDWRRLSTNRHAGCKPDAGHTTLEDFVR